MPTPKHDPTLSRLISFADLLWPDVADSFAKLPGADRQNLIDSLLSEDFDRIRELPIEQFDMLCALALAAFNEICLRKQARKDGHELVGPIQSAEGSEAAESRIQHDRARNRLPRDPDLKDLWVLLLRWLTPRDQR